MWTVYAFNLHQINTGAYACAVFVVLYVYNYRPTVETWTKSMMKGFNILVIKWVYVMYYYTFLLSTYDVLSNSLTFIALQLGLIMPEYKTT